MLREKLVNFFQTHKVLNLTSLAEFLEANGVVIDDDDAIYWKIKITIPDENDNTDIFGKTISDLQENIAIEDGEITGTLHYIEGWTDYSSKNEDGYFLALKVDNISDSKDFGTVYKSVSNSDIVVFCIDEDEELFISLINDDDTEIVIKKYAINLTLEEEEVADNPTINPITS